LLIEEPILYGVWALSFAGIGLVLHRVERHETARLEQERDRLVKRRMERLH
jgi:hypothetical protein